jgi:hypothetical protein
MILIILSFEKNNSNSSSTKKIRPICHGNVLQNYYLRYETLPSFPGTSININNGYLQIVVQTAAVFA